MARLPCMILSGGRSSRMGGGDKALMPLAGRPLLAHVAARAAAQCGPLALNANGDPARFADFRLPVIPDPVPGQPGPLAGILAAMDWAAGLGAAAVITLAVDTPFFPADLAARLAGQGGPAIAASRDRGVVRAHPIFGCWPTGLRGDLRAALAAGQRRVQVWAEAQGAIRVIWDAGGLDPFFNVNTPEDLAAAERHAGDPGPAVPPG